MPREVRIEHRYPEAHAFLRTHGSDALAVLHVLLERAQTLGGALVSQASTREIAERLEFVSKDTVHRRLRQLTRAGVLEPIGSTDSTFRSPSYRIHLNNSGIAITLDEARF